MNLVLGDGLLGSAVIGASGWQYLSRREHGFNINKKSTWKGNIPNGITCAINLIANTDTYSSDINGMFETNYRAVIRLVDYCNKNNIKLVHFSTDYVFAGQATEPYPEEAITNPIGIYGISKLQGEILLSKSSCKNVTIRTSWLFSPFGKNFVKTITRLAKEKSAIKVVHDQWGKPTYGIDLARTVLKLISNNTIYTFPILHYANQGVCSWKEFAEAIINELEHKTTIQGILTSAYPTLAKRPKYSILDTGQIEKELQIEIPTWQESLKKCIQILKSDGSL